jgi:hypothetical protein
MEATGKIIKVLTAEGGVSKRTGNPWKKQCYVLETIEQYPKKIPFEVFGEERIKQLNLQLEEVVTIHIEIDGNEWNGKWFPKIQCYNVTRQQQAQTVAAQPQHTEQVQQAAPPPQQAAAPFPPAQPEQGDGSADDLPF